MEWSEGVQRLAGPRPRQRMPGCWFSLFVRGVRPGERAWGARRRPGGRRESRQGSESGRAGSPAWDIRDRVFGREAAVSERGSGSIGAVRGPVGGFGCVPGRPRPRGGDGPTQELVGSQGWRTNPEYRLELYKGWRGALCPAVLSANHKRRGGGGLEGRRRCDIDSGQAGPGDFR